MKRINKNTHMHIELVYLQFQLHPFLVGTVNVDVLWVKKSRAGGVVVSASDYEAKGLWFDPRPG